MLPRDPCACNAISAADTFPYIYVMPSRRTSTPAWILAGLLFAYVVYPVGAMLGQSLTLPVSDYRAEEMGWNPDRQPFAAPLRRLVAEPNARDAIARTTLLAAATVAIGSLWGLGLALLWWRREFPGRRVFAALGYAPILMPPLVGTLAFFRLIGEGGALWRFISGGTGRPWVNGFGQVLIVHGYSFGIYAYAYVSAALEDVDVSQEEAARNLGASGWRVFMTTVWPAIRAPLLASAFITFMAASASFTAPYILDNSRRYLTVEILNNEGDPGMQRALSVVLAAIALLALPAFLYINRRGRFGEDVALAVKGAARRRLPPASPSSAACRVTLSILAALVLLAPPLTVVFSAIGTEYPTAQTQALLGSVTALSADDWNSLGRSALYAAAAAGLDIGLALAIALALRRSRVLPATLVEFAVMLALALPGSALAIALLSVFNGRSALAFGLPLGGSAAILILAYFIRNLPLAVRPVRAALGALGAELENAAAGLGAAQPIVLWRVTLPLLLPSVIAAALICFITALGEYVASKLLYGPLTRPVSIRIDELFRSNPASAYALALWLMIGSAAVICVARVVRRR
jgi:iron(III) transport system permease protein